MIVDEMTNSISWVDQHCHLSDATAAEAIEEAAAAGVSTLIDVGCDVNGSQACIARAERFPNVWATAGVHPHEADGGIDGLADLLGHPRVVGVGECGLDYHYMHSEVEAQRRVFAEQIDLANANDLALVIHTRDAWPDTFEILESAGVPVRTVLHCFTGGPAEAERALAMGLVISFSGIVTFPSAPEVREAAAMCPPDRYLVETDSPYLSPVPLRGKKNRPVNVAVVGTAVAEIRGVSVGTVARETSATARWLYGLAEEHSLTQHPGGPNDGA